VTHRNNCKYRDTANTRQCMHHSLQLLNQRRLKESERIMRQLPVSSPTQRLCNLHSLKTVSPGWDSQAIVVCRYTVGRGQRLRQAAAPANSMLCMPHIR
jgi:hypothetical protein